MVLGLIRSKLVSSRENIVDTIASSFFIGCYSNLQVTRTGIKSWTSSILGHFRLFALELFALEHRKLFHRHNGENVMDRRAPLFFFFIRSSSILQITRTGIKSHTSSILGQMGIQFHLQMHPPVLSVHLS